MYFYWQKEGGRETWHLGLASVKQEILEKHSPSFTTVLSVSRPLEDCPADEVEKLKYLGPFYVDFDCDSIEQAIEQTGKFLEKLEDKGVNLDSLFIYATGGRGFHIEIPLATLIQKPPKDGLISLPLIYREMAYRLYVDTLDLRVYSTKRGRMWRTVNIERENGHYKVPVSLSEFRAMTEQSYRDLTSTPRAYGKQVVQPQEAQFTHDLAVMFSEALLKVGDGLKKRRAGAKADAAMVAKFKGQLPPTLKAIMKGEHLKEGAGWNEIAMQIAITAYSGDRDRLVRDRDRAVR